MPLVAVDAVLTGCDGRRSPSIGERESTSMLLRNNTVSSRLRNSGDVAAASSPMAFRSSDGVGEVRSRLRAVRRSGPAGMSRAAMLLGISANGERAVAVIARI